MKVLIRKYKGNEFSGKGYNEDFCDWLELTDINAIKNLRNINDDGLSTIIPTNEKNDNWMEECAYSVITSFFTLIGNEKIEIKIEDWTKPTPIYYSLNSDEEILSTINKIKKSNFYLSNNHIQDEFDK